jgi:hypothetical protein
VRIDSSNRSQNVGRAGGTARANGASFVPAGLDAPSRAAPAAPLSAVGGLDALLALQSVGGPLEGRRRAVKRGATLLDLLEETKADLLLGGVSAGRLDTMVATLATLRERSLPELDALLDDIELRARVELAKLGRFPEV